MNEGAAVGPEEGDDYWTINELIHTCQWPQLGPRIGELVDLMGMVEISKSKLSPEAAAWTEAYLPTGVRMDPSDHDWVFTAEPVKQ